MSLTECNHMMTSFASTVIYLRARTQNRTERNEAICSTLQAFEENINVCVLMICDSPCYGKSTTHHFCILHEILRALGTKRTLT